MVNWINVLHTKICHNFFLEVWRELFLNLILRSNQWRNGKRETHNGISIDFHVTWTTNRNIIDRRFENKQEKNVDSHFVCFNQHKNQEEEENPSND